MTFDNQNISNLIVKTKKHADYNTFFCDESVFYKLDLLIKAISYISIAICQDFNY